MTLDNIKTLYNEGNKETGRAQLIELLQAEPENAKAWAYFGAKTIDLEQRKYCYLKSLEFEPDNATIQARLDKLNEYDPVAPPEFEMIDEEEDDPIAPPELAVVKKGVKGVKNDGGMSTFQKLTLAILGLVAICIMGSLGVVMMYVVTDGQGVLQVKVQPTLVVPTTRVELPIRPLPTPTVDDRPKFGSNCIARKFIFLYGNEIAELDTIKQNQFKWLVYVKTYATGHYEGSWTIMRIYSKTRSLKEDVVPVPLILFDIKTGKVTLVGKSFKQLLTSDLVRFDVSECDDFTEL